MFMRRCVFLLFLAALCSITAAFAQSGSLALSSGTAVPGATVALSLSLNSSSASPAALQWTLTYSSANIAQIVAAAGPALAASGKDLTCAAVANSYTCIAAGMNTNVVPNGIIATINVTVAAQAAGTISLTPTGTLGASRDGSAIPLTAVAGNVTVQTSVSNPTLTGLTCTPASLAPLGNAGCTVTANMAAPSGGVAVSISSSNNAVSVPAQVVIPGGATTATFQVTAGTVTTDQDATLTATLGGSSRAAAVTVLASGGSLASLSCASATVSTGGTVPCTVLLTAPAASTGVTVVLTSSRATLSVPASIALPASAISATFTATASAVLVDEPVALTATLGGISRSTSVTVMGPVASLASLACASPSVSSGGTVTCTVLLSGAAGASGAVVSLSSNRGSLSVPASVGVPAGSTGGTFTAVAGSVPANDPVTVTATLGGVSRSASVTVLGPGSRLASLSCAAPTVSAGGAVSCTVSLTASGGAVTIALSSNHTSLSVPASIEVPAGSLTANFTATADMAARDGSAMITASLGGETRAVSLLLVASPLAPVSLVCSPSTLVGGAAGSCTLVLNRPAGAGGAAVSLSSSSASLVVPATISIPANASSGAFTVTASGVAGDETATLTAILGSGRVTSSLYLISASKLMQLSCETTGLISGTPVQCTVVSAGPAPAGGLVVTLASSDAALSVPASVTIPAGSTAGRFAVTMTATGGGHAAMLLATVQGTTRTTTLYLREPAPLGRLVCDPPAGTPDAPVRARMCAIMLAAPAPPGGAVVSLSTDNAAVSVTPTVAIPAGSNIGRFSVVMVSSGSSVSATLTATLVGTAQSLTLRLLGPAALDRLSCESAVLTAGARIICSILLDGAAAEVTTISLTSSTANVSVPPSVTVAGGLSSAAFAALVSADPSVKAPTVLTATFNGSTRTFSLNAPDPASVSSLWCAPATLPAGGTAACTVALTKAAPAAGVVVSLQTKGGELSVSPNMTIAGGTSSGTFTVRAGVSPDNTTGQVEAVVSGSSRTTSVTVQAAPAISAITCQATTLLAGSKTDCTVTLSKPAGELTLGVSSSRTDALAAPTQVAIAPGAVSATFSVAPTGSISETVELSANLGSSTQHVSLAVHEAGKLHTLACAPDTVIAGSTTCTVELSAPAAVGGAAVRLAADSTRLEVPDQVRIPEGEKSRQFPVRVRVSDKNQESRITAEMSDTVKTARLALPALRPAALTCTPQALVAGETATCEIRLNSSDVDEVTRLELSSNSPFLKLPAVVTTRPRQATLTFEIFAEPGLPDHGVVMQASFGAAATRSVVVLTPAAAPLLKVPPKQLAIYDREIAFTVSASDARGLPVVLSSGDLPPGGAFDAASGSFSWTPNESQQDSYVVQFSATNSGGASASAEVVIEVDAGKPVIRAVLNGASQRPDGCSPGAIASVVGKWLAAEPQSEPSGSAMALGGTSVHVNGAAAPVVQVSPTQVQFVCPQAPPGTPLEISVETESGATGTLTSVMKTASPGLFSTDGSGSGQGLVVFAGTSMIAMARNFWQPGQPAQPGDLLVMRTTGLLPDGPPPLVKLGGIDAQVLSVQPAGGIAGAYDLRIKVPPGTPVGKAVPLMLQVSLPDGQLVESNTVTVHVEPVRN